MSKALVGILALGALGGLAFAASKAGAAAPAGGALVTGASGTVYGLKKLSEQSSGEGIVETWEVSDAHGPMLQYVQFQGDDSTRQLTGLADGRAFTDTIVLNALADFGILVTS